MKLEENKRIERKLKRFSARLKTSKGLICTNVPGSSLIICNAGQATGLEKEMVFLLIKEFSLNITFPKYVSEKGESHSFLTFKNLEEAGVFLKTFNGKAILHKNETPLYLSFVEKVPNSDIICPHSDPKGLILINDFITENEELEFLEIFEFTPHEDSNLLKNRQVRHYGYEFRYGSNDVDLSSSLEEKIPVECDLLWKRLKEYDHSLGIPDQLTVNKYIPGQGIPSHVDKHSPFSDTILSLSLGSSVVMDWKHHTGKYVPVVVKSRSLLIMRDEARYDWRHGIQPRTWDPVIEQRSISPEDADQTKVITSDTVPRKTRISLTFRWTRSGPCLCLFKTLCDSVDKPIGDNMDDCIASKLEEMHVHQVYEQIAGHFSTTRHKPWPKVVEFMRQVPTGAVVIDLGCGNGKNILKRNDILQVAGERSSGLLDECRQHVHGVGYAQCVRLDLLQVGIRDSSADFIICIAVIHHFCTKARRLQAVSTINRLLRPNGQALITVWAKDQTMSNYLSKNKDHQNGADNYQVTVGGINLPVHENRTQFRHKNLLVPWKLRRKDDDDKLSTDSDSTLLRFYHVFEEGELDDLCKEGGLEVMKSFYEEGNWCAICRKL